MQCFNLKIPTLIRISCHSTCLFASFIHSIGLRKLESELKQASHSFSYGVSSYSPPSAFTYKLINSETPADIRCTRSNELNPLPPIYISWGSFTLSTKTCLLHNSGHSIWARMLLVTRWLVSCKENEGSLRTGVGFWGGFKVYNSVK